VHIDAEEGLRNVLSAFFLTRCPPSYQSFRCNNNHNNDCCLVLRISLPHFSYRRNSIAVCFLCGCTIFSSSSSSCPPTMDLVQLDALCSDLTVAARAFRSLCDSSGNSSPGSNVSVKEPLFLSANPQDAEHEIAIARRNLCGITTRLQTLLSGPTCFIRRMAAQVSRFPCPVHSVL